jgi:hypothetical protein
MKAKPSGSTEPGASAAPPNADKKAPAKKAPAAKPAPPKPAPKT